MADGNVKRGFNPERASQAIPTWTGSAGHRHLSAFQSRTGFPGHSDVIIVLVRLVVVRMFQSRTGFPGHSDTNLFRVNLCAYYKFQSRTGFPGHSDYQLEVYNEMSKMCFNPERASQAIPTSTAERESCCSCRFQSRTGFPGHS